MAGRTFRCRTPTSHIMKTQTYVPAPAAACLIALMRAASSEPEFVHRRNAAVVANLALVHHVVDRLPGRGSRDDLVSVGTGALLEAVVGFDASRQVPFGAYAAIHIRRRVLEYLAHHGESGWVLGTHSGRQLYRLRQALWRDGREPEQVTNRELATSANVPLGAARKLRPLLRPCASLYPTFPGGEVVDLLDGTRLDERFVSGPATPVEAVSSNDDRAELHRALQGLDWRSRFVVERAFGLDGEAPRTHAEVAALLGLTRQRVQQLVAGTLAALRASWRS